MSKEDGFIVLTDMQSTEIMLGNAGIDFEMSDYRQVGGHVARIETEDGVIFHFSPDGELLGMDNKNEKF